MIYTIKDLESLLISPAQSDKWGRHTREVLSIVHDIVKAPCSVCMLRRKISILNNIMRKYGDSVVGSYSASTYNTDGNRTACPDCVAKHLSQSFVLQSEFYQGYTEYLPLIEAHLAEAIEECPKNDEILQNILKNAQKSIIIDKNPQIPVIFAIEQLPDGIKTKNTVEKPKIAHKNSISVELSRIPAFLMPKIHKMLENLKKIDKSSDIQHQIEWSGRLACVSDLISQYAMLTARNLRSIRLYTMSDACTDPEYDEYWAFLEDLTVQIGKYMENTKNTPKNA